MPDAHGRQALTEMLAKSLGENSARKAVDDAAAQLGMQQQLSRDDALRLLEHIAQQAGIVGIAARFAKSRVHLVWG